MNKTKIEWCDATWNPVTGCLHACDYCYARRIAERFGCGWETASGNLPVLDKPARGVRSGKTESRIEPYPYSFTPTFHRYRLNEPQRMKKPQTIFVCSMADLFGSWVPDEWIEEIFAACRRAPQHRYLFLTKNPVRYMALAQTRKLPKGDNFWYGSTITTPDKPFWWSDDHHTFVSIEPLLKPFGRFGSATQKIDWIVMGAMTGPGAREHQPKAEWVQEIVAAADAAGVPVLMKDSLVPIVGEESMRREFPWGKEESI